MFNLRGRVAVITGASSGLGKQMSKAFAGQGADLVLMARRVERLEELRVELQELGVRVLPVKCDVTNVEEIKEAARLAGAADFIERLPEGYNTMLTNNGSNFSQGQRQLLAIARAAVADPPVMILDEATSSIDTRTEAIVQRGMDKLMEGRTVFVIAHRLSTVMNSDVIMVLDHGKIIERGSHDQLIAEKGTYYQLYTGAFELE